MAVGAVGDDRHGCCVRTWLQLARLAESVRGSFLLALAEGRCAALSHVALVHLGDLRPVRLRAADGG